MFYLKSHRNVIFLSLIAIFCFFLLSIGNVYAYVSSITANLSITQSLSVSCTITNGESSFNIPDCTSTNNNIFITSIAHDTLEIKGQKQYFSFSDKSISFSVTNSKLLSLTGMSIYGVDVFNNTNVYSKTFSGSTLTITFTSGVLFENSDELIFQFLIPSYTVLTYVQSTGTQAIDTGLTMEKTDSVRIVYDAQLTNNSSWGGVNGYMQHQASLGGGNRGIFVVDYNGTTSVENVYFNNNIVYTMNWSASYSGVDMKVAVVGMGNPNNAWFSSDAQPPQSGNWYYIKVYKENVLVRDFIPCKNANNIVGFYDIVGNNFYQNTYSSDNFVAGATVS